MEPSLEGLGRLGWVESEWRGSDENCCQALSCVTGLELIDDLILEKKDQKQDINSTICNFSKLSDAHHVHPDRS